MPIAKNPSYPALLLSQNEHRFFFTTIPVGDLFPYCFVSRRDEDPVSGFQRTLNESRADDIAKYLLRGNGSIPTNVVLSAQKNAQFKYNNKTKSISFERAEKAFLVLDGQHRLWGYNICHNKLEKEHRVPVAIYEKLNPSDETRLFIDINTLQRGVSAALLLDIKAMAQIETDMEKSLRSLFDALASSPNSALAGRLSAAKAAKGKITRVTFNRSVGKALKSSILASAKPEQILKAVTNYANAFDAELMDSHLLTRPVFFEAIFDLFDEVMARTLAEYKNAKQQSIQKVISPIGKIDFNEHGSSSKLTVNGITISMRAALQKSMTLTSSML